MKIHPYRKKKILSTTIHIRHVINTYNNNSALIPLVQYSCSMRRESCFFPYVTIFYCEKLFFLSLRVCYHSFSPSLARKFVVFFLCSEAILRYNLIQIFWFWYFNINMIYPISVLLITIFQFYSYTKNAIRGFSWFNRNFDLFFSVEICIQRNENIFLISIYTSGFFRSYFTSVYVDNYGNVYMHTHTYTRATR